MRRLHEPATELAPRRPSARCKAPARALALTLALGLSALGLSACCHSPKTPLGRQKGLGQLSAEARPDARPSRQAAYLQWLERHSMLKQAEALAQRYSGKGLLWRHPYAAIRPRAASALASTWFTAYPGATITREGASVLKTLGDERLWRAFASIGIKAMHTGPMKRSGGVTERRFTPTIDGNFDRISMRIDPGFGDEAEYRALVAHARSNGAIVIADVIPGHTGKGPDWRLAERGYQDYPGIYHIVEIDEKDWGLLPPVQPGEDSANLKPAVVDQLKAKGYLVGRLYRVIFFEPKVKETNWSATDVVEGADGKRRRWVYLHYFKAGQPTLNWIDPTFAAARLVIGDLLHAVGELGIGMLRLDANGFLGIEVDPSGAPAFSEGHPLSVTGNQLIAGTARRLGAFTFQELNLSLDDLRLMQSGGADLSYDFVTRPAYHHALVTGDARFLRLMLNLAREHGIDPATLIHALQNHDELTLELVHFWNKHKDDVFSFRGKRLKGSALRTIIRDELLQKLLAVPYNLKASNGVACTTASVIGAALGLKDLRSLSKDQQAQVRKLHLLLAFYNAFQPGVFALSGWDLVGALPLPAPAVSTLMADGDTRWINRGAYDLLGDNPKATTSTSGIPRTATLYGPVPLQLAQPDSFASQLKRLLAVRERYRINQAKQLEVPEVRNPGLLVLVHQLPAGGGIEVTAVNFGRGPVSESLRLSAVAGKSSLANLLEPANHDDRLIGGRLMLRLAAFEGKALLIR
ncbi:MAG: maltose alpha-D-glucosyltransferase [Proteobacteria bacterium]|nr:maltose alpha-D-glucosyltransferase [Pseudomonadota bacterium]